MMMPCKLVWMDEKYMQVASLVKNFMYMAKFITSIPVIKDKND